MKRAFALVYWRDDGWYVGEIGEVPEVFSQGETLKELKENIQDAFNLMMEEGISVPVRDCKSENWRKNVRNIFSLRVEEELSIPA